MAIELFQRPGVIRRAGGFEAEQIVRGEVFEAIGALKVVAGARVRTGHPFEVVGMVLSTFGAMAA